MKQLKFLLVLFLTMVIVACGSSSNAGNNKTERDENATTPAAIDGFEKYENAEMSFVYPSSMKITTENFGFNAANADGSCKLSVTYNAGGPTLDQMEQTQKNYEGMLIAQGEKIESSELKDNNMIIRSTNEGRVKLSFIVKGEGTKCLSSQLNYPADSASVYDSYLEIIINSMGIK